MKTSLKGKYDLRRFCWKNKGLEHLASSVGREWDSWSQGSESEPHVGLLKDKINLKKKKK